MQVSSLGFGAEAIGRKGRSFEEADRTLNAVVDAGITLLDSASAYGNSEAFIGRALAHRRDEITVVTKCGWTQEWEPAWSKRELEATIERSLVDLKTDALDVLMLHSCPLEDLQRGEVIEVVQRARDAGKAKCIGYSGDNDALAFAVRSGRFDVIETSFSMLDQANAPAIAAGAQRGMGVLIKRPIANAVPGRADKPKSDYAAQYWPRWQEIGLKDADIGGLPWLEAAARFSAYWPGVTSILIGSSHASHMLENLAHLRGGPLPPTMVRRLTEAFDAANKKANGSWIGLG